MDENILVTSGYNFDGYKIVNYISHESTQIVLGTGFLSSLDASFADLTGSNSSSYEEKLNWAETEAKRKLKNKAYSAGGNAIIGLDVDYTVFIRDLIGVIVSGTIVKIEPKSHHNSTFLNKFYNNSIPIRCNSLDIECPKNHNYLVRLNGFRYKNEEVAALCTNIIFHNVFNDEIEINDVIFSNITLSEDNTFLTAPVELKIDHLDISSMKSVSVIITRYLNSSDIVIVDDKFNELTDLNEKSLAAIKKFYGSDCVTNYSIDEGFWKCYCGCLNDIKSSTCQICKRVIDHLTVDANSNSMDNFLAIDHYTAIEPLKSAKEIYEYLLKLNCNDEEFIVLLTKIKQLSEGEKAYGNLKRSALAEIKKIYATN